MHKAKSEETRIGPTPTHHLAQANIARMRAPLDGPLMSGFAARLDPVNALADGSPGFVWRLQTEEGDATAIRAFDDELILFNMSVWISVEALFQYTYHSDHIHLLANRKQWFTPLAGPASCSGGSPPVMSLPWRKRNPA